MMRIAIGSDHGGYCLKSVLSQLIRDLGHEVLDFGTNSDASVDYPDYAVQVGRAIQEDRADRGILLCGSGVGVCIAANKMAGVYAAICHDAYSAKQGVEHDRMNVLCLGGRVVGDELAKVLVRNFLEARFLGEDPGEERHARRVNKVRAIEEEGMKSWKQE